MFIILYLVVFCLSFSIVSCEKVGFRKPMQYFFDVDAF